jgi:hypothetical protein
MIMSNFTNAEDAKLETLATSTLKRTGAKQAAALRDSTGRTYVAINVASPSLTLDAVEAVFTVALASQISGIEGVVLAGEKSANVKVIREHSSSVAIFHVDSDGSVSNL